MGDTEGEGGYSRESTPTPRADSRLSIRSAASEERERSRSRSPPNSDRENQRLVAENRALKRQVVGLQRQVYDLSQQLVAIREEAAKSSSKQDAMMELLRDAKDELKRLRKNEVSETHGGETPAKKKTRKRAAASESEEPIATPMEVQQHSTTTREAPVSQEISAPKGEQDPKNPGGKIPPVVLRKKERWTAVSKMLTNKAVYTKARLTGEGIQIHPATPKDHREITRLLAQEKEEYHTYRLPENKLLRVVIRGIPDGVSSEEITEDLLEQGFRPVSVVRLKNRRTKAAMPLALVQVALNEEKILDVNRCCGLVVRVERQRATTEVGQCHRCQGFGHVQSNCAAAPRCVKCAGTHHSGDCTKAASSPAKCANCGGAHPASYRGCSKFPKKKVEAPKRKPEAAPRSAAATAPRAPAKTVTPGTSFAAAAAAKGGSASRKAAPPPKPAPNNKKTNKPATATPAAPHLGALLTAEQQQTLIRWLLENLNAGH